LDCFLHLEQQNLLEYLQAPPSMNHNAGTAPVVLGLLGLTEFSLQQSFV
jgi:hypothetical protein